MKYKLKYTLALLVAACGMSIVSCSDWTETEHVDINYRTMEDADNYPAYLEALRQYRNTDHKLIYAWFALPKDAPADQHERLTSIPDSVDVIVLHGNTDIHEQVAKDLAKVRTDKGMKVLYQVDFDELISEFKEVKANYELQCALLRADYESREGFWWDPEMQAELETKLAEIPEPNEVDYILNHLTPALQGFKTLKIDGMMFAFDGKIPDYLTPDEKYAYNLEKIACLGIASDWHARNPEMLYEFLGKPQFLTDVPELLDEFGKLFIRSTATAGNASEFALYYQMALLEGFAENRLGVMTSICSLDPEDTKTGYFNDGVTRAADAMAEWIVGKHMGAVGILNAQNDYYTQAPDVLYPSVRKIIRSANPNHK